MNNSKLQHALHYASLGIPVLPLHFMTAEGTCSCGEAKPCKKGKHPFGRLVPHGLTDATTVEATIRQWFDGKPYNIGICTGTESRIFVLDRDDRDGGDRSLDELEEKYSGLPVTLTQRTGNGFHYVFNLPSDVIVKNSAKKLAPGLDIRGIGGYIVAAPSVHENGNIYTWIDCTLPTRSQIVDAPQWLLDLIAQAATVQPPAPVKNHFAAAGSVFSWPDKITDGEGREDFIIRAAGHLRGTGAAQATIERTLLDYNQLHIVPPLDDAAVLDRTRRYVSVTPISPAQAHPPANDDNWPDPEPLDEHLPPVEAFPLQLLPKMIAAYVKDVADRMTCPLDFAAIAAVVALATAIGSRICCRPYANGTWLVPAGAWGMVVAAPSAVKTPPLSEMLRPLQAMDKQAADQYARDLVTYDIDKAIYDNAVKAAVKAGNNTPGVAPPIEPTMTRYMVNDSTYEMLVAIAKANPQGFLIMRDELIGWFHSLAKDNQKEARGLYLTGWSGTESYATDRIGRGHVRADCVNLSLIGTIQPNVLRQVVHDAVAGGAGDDGLVPRFQFAVYPDPVRKYAKVDRRPDLHAMQHYIDTIKKLVHLDLGAVGASITADGIAYLPFDDVAQTIFDDWRQALEDRIRAPDSEEHPAMLAHLGKYRSLFPKLALILHLAAGKTGPISRDAALRAKFWTEYLETHARRIYHTATNRAMQSAVALANKIKAGKLGDGFTKSDVLVREWSGLRIAEEVKTALTILCDMNWLTVIDDRRTGGRPAERYYFNPKVKRAA
jgi:putative DNA primase/helicase